MGCYISGNDYFIR